VFGERGDPATALVYDVSTLAAVDAAREGSPHFEDALEFLRRQGLNPHAPGCDVLTLKPGSVEPPVDRLIELKSSGVRARTQEHSWDEWKSARASELQGFFYLYL
jgi:hypothetical protein